MGPILQAINYGYTSKQILDYLIKTFPKHAAKINQAIQLGYSPSQVISYLAGGRKALNEDLPGLTEHQQTVQADEKSRQRVNQGFGTAALAAGGTGAAYALSRAIPPHLLSQILPALQGNQPQPPVPPPATQTPNPQGTPTTTTNPQTGANPIQPPLAPTGTPIGPPTTPLNPTSPQINQEPTATIRNPQKNIALVKTLGLEDQINSLFTSGNTSKQISDALQFKGLIPKEKLKALTSAEGGIEGVIEDYAKEIQQKTQEPTPMEPSGQELDGDKTIEGAEIPTNVLPESTESVKEHTKEEPKIEKGSIVSVPEGVGEVKEIRNGKALVEVDGKKSIVDEKDLKKPEFSEDEIADAYDDLMKKIPEEHRSGFISWAGYDEDRNVIGFIPRGGKYEELSNISPEDAQKIKEGKGVARTTGEVREGLWVTGEDTRGGIISQIIWDRKKKHQAESERQMSFALDLPKKEKEDRGMKPIFDEMAHARGLSRGREKKMRDEERARIKKEKEEEKERLKKEKDEAKKRKKQT
jgi:hypothetical protein